MLEFLYVFKCRLHIEANSCSHILREEKNKRKVYFIIVRSLKNEKNYLALVIIPTVLKLRNFNVFSKSLYIFNDMDTFWLLRPIEFVPPLLKDQTC